MNSARPALARAMRLAAAIAVAPLVCVPAPAPADDLFVPTASVWRYLDNGSDQGTAWRAPAFSDATWASGPAQLGYGDGDEATVVGFGGDPNNRHITTYFRHTFTVANASNYFAWRLRILRDDGAVVYLNGTEVFRTNMPEGPIGFQTLASTGIGGADEGVFHEVILDPDAVVTGTNVLAVEVHQSAVNSSDLSFVLILVGITTPPLVTRGVYLQNAAPEAMTFRWRTSLPGIGRVAVGAAPGTLNTVVDEAAATTEHIVRVTGLAPATRYYYSVGTPSGPLVGGDLFHTFVTPPSPGTDRPTRVWVLGDSGTANANARAVRDAYLAFTGMRGTDVWLMLGDNAYSDGTDAEYQNAVFNTYPNVLRQIPLWPTIGNHDAISADSPTQSGVYYQVFTLPTAGEAGGLASGTEAYYAFDHANIHFICLDSEDTSRAPGSPMLTWLAADLAATTADWIIVFFHHPPYTKGSHNSDDLADSAGRIRDMRANVLPILEAHGVDLVLTGHSHVYERSFLLDGHYGFSSSLLPSMILDAGDGRVGSDGPYHKPTAGAAAHEGAVYAVAGSGGQTSNNPPLNHPAMFASLNTLGSLVLDIDGDRLDATFVSSTGAILDFFTMTKGTPTSSSGRHGMRVF